MIDVILCLQRLVRKIRDIVELKILRQIEQALGGRIAMKHFFEIIVGTSFAVYQRAL